MYMERIRGTCMERMRLWKSIWDINMYGTYTETYNGTYMECLGKYVERIWNGNVYEEKFSLMGGHYGDDARIKPWREVEIPGTCAERMKKRIWALRS